MNRRPLLCIAVAIAVAPLVGAPADARWHVRVWRSDDGLPNNYVTGLAQTPDGFLWVATYSCLARFDGVRFENYYLHKFAGVDTSKITALQMARDGSLWVGSLHGAVLRLNRRGARVFSTGLPEKQVQTIVEGADGAIWIGYNYYGGTIYRIRNDVITPFSKRQGVPPGQIPAGALAADARGRIWLGKDGRLCRFEDDHFETVSPLGKGTIRLAPAADGGLWVCCGSQLLKYENGGGLTAIGSYAVGRRDPLPTVVLEDHNGEVWIGTAESGLFHSHGSEFTAVSTSDPEISSLSEDRSGNVWVGTGNGGLDLVEPGVITLETTAAGLPSNAVRSVCEDATGGLWATTDNGRLVRREQGRWTNVPLQGGGPHSNAFCVTADRSGGIWVGTRSFGVIRLRGNEQTLWGRAQGLLGNEARGILVSRDGDVWIAESDRDALQRLRKGVLESLPLPPKARMIRAMAEDSRGRVWLGTTNGMLLVIENGRLRDETAHTANALLSIRSLYAAPDGGLWIAYADDGLGWFKDGTFQRLDANQGFPENNLSQIVADDRGWLWFGGDHGIFRARQAEMENLALGRAKDVSYVRYGKSEGLFSLEAGFGSSPGAARSSDGRLWIPMRTALAVVDPAARPDETQASPVLIDRVSVDAAVVASYGRTVPVGPVVNLSGPAATLTLAASHRRIEFAYTALSYSPPENIRFRYRLEGFDSGWIDAGTQREAVYSRLPPGQYRFLVQACSNGGHWGAKSAALGFAVNPFLWQTWWFKLAAVAAFTLATGAIVRSISLRRVRAKLGELEQQAALAKERARIARDLHDEFGTRLTELGLMADLDFKQAREGRPNRYCGEVADGLRSLERDLDMIIWAVNPKNDSLSHLVNFICRATDEFLKRSDISCRFDLPDELPPFVLTPELRQHLFLVVREAVSNVVKHSKASTAKIGFRLAGGVLHFRLEDDGQGFSLDEAGCRGRNGLQNMRSRIEELGGEFQVQSGREGGTRVEFHFPLGLPAEFVSNP